MRKPWTVAATIACLATVLTLSAETAPDRGDDSEPAITNIRVNVPTVARYAKFEVSFEVHGHWRNPFDPAQVAVDCLIDPPQGSSMIVPAFFYQAYQREEVDNREQLVRVGTPVWKVRFAPTEAGTYRFRLRLTNAGRTVESEPAAFTCTGGSLPGFVRVSKINPRYFERDDGSPFFVVGENMLFTNPGGTYAMDRWLTDLARAGGNMIRTWWCWGGMDLESRQSAAPRRGAGWYDLESAWRADRQVELAEELGIAVMPTIETQQYLRIGVDWEKYSYNAANGGPVVSPADYFTNPKAAELVRNRLRYIVARWSYSTAIFSWMFWNEVDSCNGYTPAAVGAWHREMAQYLLALDPNRHLINSNYGNLDGQKEVDDLPGIDLVATNLYTRHDSASSALWAARFMTARRAKPYLLTEFGLGHYDRWKQNDPTGLALHDGLWGCAFGGAAGGAMVWEWDDWVAPCDLYHLYAPFASVMKDVPFSRYTWKPVASGTLLFKDPGHPSYFASVFFEGFSTNYAFNTCPKPRTNVFTVTPEGTVDRPECFNGALAPSGTRTGAGGAAARADAAVATRDSACTFLITMPRDGELILHVPRLSGEQHPILEATVDGKIVLHRELARDDPNATWDYFGRFPIPLSAGPHRVTVQNVKPATADNFWPDRVTVAYELTNYLERNGPDLNFTGLQSNACILLWLRNPASTWLFARENRPLTTQPEGRLPLTGISDGDYLVTWTDTFTGDVLRRDSIAVHDGKVTLTTPPIARSAVAKLLRLGGASAP